MQDISNLLTQVNLIQQKYDEFAEYTGDNFNVFEILNIYSSEISHSAFIANLLNAKGKHGQKDIFLRLFLEEIKDLFTLDNTKLEALDSSKSHTKIEAYTGRVNYENIEGGRIDILITDGVNNIIIENKVWAGDQPHQLVRYNNNDKNAPIIYLTLDGKEPAVKSKGTLKIGEHFICVSYEKHLVNWLEKCVKEMANKPIVRETLNQYLHLVKQLTNQTNNNKMTQEIINKVISNNSNFTAFKMLISSQNNILKPFLIDNYIPFLKQMANKYEMELGINEEGFSGMKLKWAGFHFTNEKMKNHNNITINFSFNSANSYSNLIFGFVPSTNNEQLDNRIKSLFSEYFGAYKSTHWICFKDFEKYQNWTNLNTIQKLYFDLENFKEEFEDKLSKMVKIMNEVLTDH